jgi:hypothetical protein
MLLRIPLMQAIQNGFDLTDVSNECSSCVVVVHIFLHLDSLQFSLFFPTDRLFLLDVHE